MLKEADARPFLKVFFLFFSFFFLSDTVTNLALNVTFLVLQYNVQWQSSSGDNNSSQGLWISLSPYPWHEINSIQDNVNLFGMINCKVHKATCKWKLHCSCWTAASGNCGDLKVTLASISLSNSKLEHENCATRSSSVMVQVLNRSKVINVPAAA